MRTVPPGRNTWQPAIRRAATPARCRLAAPGSVFEQLLRGKGFVQIADAANGNPHLTSSWSREVVEITGARTVLVVPLLKDNALLGAIFAYRQEVRPFSDKQVARWRPSAN